LIFAFSTVKIIIKNTVFMGLMVYVIYFAFGKARPTLLKASPKTASDIIYASSAQIQ
jgi:hypothetical protein